MRRFILGLAIGLLLCMVIPSWLPGLAAAEPVGGKQYYIIQQNGLYGFIDNRGQVVIKPQFADARDFSEGLAAVKSADDKLFGYIDTTGNYVISPRFKYAYDFSEGLAPVDSGYINTDGQLIIDRTGWPFHQGRAQLWGKPAVFIDKNGAVILKTSYDHAWEVQSGLLAFVQDGKMGFMTWNQEVVIPPRYLFDRSRSSNLFAENITPVAIKIDNDYKWGFIDKRGKTVVPFDYEWAEQFKEGMAVVSKNKLYGYVDAQGREAIPPKYQYAFNLSEGLAAVEVDGLWGFIDKHGNMVIKPEYLGLMWGVPMAFHEGLAPVRTSGGTGVINKAGEMVIAPIYHSVGAFIGGIAEVRLHNGQRGYINRNGKYIWQPSR